MGSLSGLYALCFALIQVQSKYPNIMQILLQHFTNREHFAGEIDIVIGLAVIFVPHIPQRCCVKMPVVQLRPYFCCMAGILYFPAARD